MTNKLVVGNKEQRILFIGEIAGQISDGKWENASPNNHYQVWCGLENSDILVAQGTEVVGRNFYANKSNYNLVSKDLLDVVGDRMLWLVKLAMVSVKVEEMVLTGSHWDLFENLDEYTMAHNKFLNGKANEYETEKILKLAAMGITLKTYEQANAYEFTMTDLRNNLRGLAVAMKNYRS